MKSSVLILTLLLLLSCKTGGYSDYERVVVNQEKWNSYIDLNVPDELDRYRIIMEVKGRVDGDVTLLIGNSESMYISYFFSKGEVNERIVSDWYESTGRIKLINNSSGELEINYLIR